MYYVMESYNGIDYEEDMDGGCTIYATFEEAREAYLDAITNHVENRNNIFYIIPGLDDVKEKDYYDCFDYNEEDYTVFQIGKVEFNKYISYKL